MGRVSGSTKEGGAGCWVARRGTCVLRSYGGGLSPTGAEKPAGEAGPLGESVDGNGEDDGGGKTAVEGGRRTGVRGSTKGDSAVEGAGRTGVRGSTRGEAGGD